MEMNMLGWSSEAGNPNIQDLKENWQKQRERERGELWGIVCEALKFKLHVTEKIVQQFNTKC